MSCLPRAGLHLLAAVGATGVFAAAAIAGAHQATPAEPPAGAVDGAHQTAPAEPTPGIAAEAARQNQPPARSQADSQIAQTPRATRVPPERSVSGNVREIGADGLVIETQKGQQLQVQPAPGALIRLNGKTSPLDSLEAGDRVVILGQAQPRLKVFLAHAITARRPR